MVCIEVQGFEMRENVNIQKLQNDTILAVTDFCVRVDE